MIESGYMLTRMRWSSGWCFDSPGRWAVIYQLDWGWQQRQGEENQPRDGPSQFTLRTSAMKIDSSRNWFYHMTFRLSVAFFSQCIHNIMENFSQMFPRQNICSLEQEFEIFICYRKEQIWSNLAVWLSRAWWQLIKRLSDSNKLLFVPVIFPAAGNDAI